MYRLMPFTRRALSAIAAFSSLGVAAPTLTLAQASCAAGESSIRAGDARLASFTPIHVDSMEMSMEREGTTRGFATYTQHVQRTTLNGAPALLFVQRGSTPRGLSLDSVWVDARTWAPLRHFAATPAGGMEVAYANGRITGRVTTDGTAREVDEAIPAGMFDFSVANAAVAAVPLCDGAVVRVTGYDPAEGKTRETIYRVVTAERVEIGGAPRDVWAVDMQLADRTVRMQVDRATRRELAWKMEIPGGASVRGTSQLFPHR